MFKKFLMALCVAFLSLHGFAADSVVSGNTEYILVTQGRALIYPGDVKRDEEKCVTEKAIFTQTTTCTWAATLTATSSDIKATDGSSSTTTDPRREMTRTAIAIALVVLVVVLVTIKFEVLAFYLLLVNFVVSLGVISAMISIQAFFALTFVLFATCVCLLGIAALNSRRNLPTFYWSAYVYVFLMLLAAVIVW